MKFNPQQSLALITAMTVLSYTMHPAPLAAADTHVVNLQELQQQASASLTKRARNLADIERVLSLPQAQEAMGKSNITAKQATAAVAKLSEEEINRLADRARSAEQDVQGGIIVGLLALIGLVVVILIVVAVVSD